MPAMLQRLFYGLDGKEFPQVQNLHRAEALFVEDEWTWRASGERGAHRFPTVEAAEAARSEHSWTDASGHTVKPFAVVCGEPDINGLRQREADRIATALAGVEPRRNETGFNEPAEGENFSGGPATKPQDIRPTDAGVRKAPGKHTRAAAEKFPRAARTRTGADFARIYRERCGGHHVSPAEAYENLERRHLD